MEGRQRRAGPAKRRRHLEEAAGIAACVGVGPHVPHARRLAVAELSGRLGLDDVVDPGAAAAELLLARLEERELRDCPQRGARLGLDALRMLEVARVLERDG